MVKPDLLPVHISRTICVVANKSIFVPAVTHCMICRIVVYVVYNRAVEVNREHLVYGEVTNVLGRKIGKSIDAGAIEVVSKLIMGTLPAEIRPRYEAASYHF